MIIKTLLEGISKKFALFQLIAIFPITLHGQEVQHYNLDVNINLDEKKIDVKGTLLIDFEYQDSITFYLWRNTTLSKVSSDKKEVPYTFDTIEPLPLRFIGNAGKLAVANPKRGKEPQLIKFEYRCDMQRNMVGFGKTFTDEWIEMGYYSAWYPVHEGSGNFISEVRVSTEENLNM